MHSGGGAGVPRVWRRKGGLLGSALPHEGRLSYVQLPACHGGRLLEPQLLPERRARQEGRGESVAPVGGGSLCCGVFLSVFVSEDGDGLLWFPCRRFLFFYGVGPVLCAVPCCSGGYCSVDLPDLSSLSPKVQGSGARIDARQHARAPSVGRGGGRFSTRQR